jgi:hypothetical protein
VTIPDLVKRGWRFEPIWDAPVGIWTIAVTKPAWGIRCTDPIWSRSWDAAHEKARAWADSEETFINGPEQRDTMPAPAMEAAE